MLKARETTLEKISGLPVWWKPQKDSEGHHLGELLSKPFSVSVLQSFADCPGVPDLRLSNSDTLLLVETKLNNALEESQIKAIGRLAGRREKTKAYLVLAPGAYGTAPYQAGELDRAYTQGEQARIPVGFMNLALSVTWACDQLELEALE